MSKQNQQEESTTGKFLGSKKAIDGNPFLSDDISGNKNKILNAIKTPTNCMIYRTQPPTLHVIQNDTPTILNLNKRDFNLMPQIPNKIKVLFIEENSIKDISIITEHPTLEVLDVSKNLIESIDFKFPPYLRAFIGSSNRITSIPTGMIFYNLLVLNLSGNHITTFGQWESFPILRVLNLSFNEIEKFDLNLPSLQELSLQNNKLTNFEVSNGDNLTHLDLSNNDLDDLHFIDYTPHITHFLGEGNQFGPCWVSFVVSSKSASNLTHINGHEITEGERAIHRDRVSAFIKSTKAPHPHDEIVKIRRLFNELKTIKVDQQPYKTIDEMWLKRSEEKKQRYDIVCSEIKKIPSIITIEKGVLSFYGPVTSDLIENEDNNKILEGNFRQITFNYSPIQRRSEYESCVVQIGTDKQPIILTLNHNMLNTLNDLLFLSHFTSTEILNIEGNFASKMSLFKQFVCYLMPNLHVINGQKITRADRIMGINCFQELLIVSNNLKPETEVEEEEVYEVPRPVL